MEPGVSGASWLGMPPGNENCLKRCRMPSSVCGIDGIDFGVGAFEVCVGDHAGSAVAGSADVDRVQVVSLDGAVHVRVDEVQAGRGAPVAEQAGFDLLFW